MKNNYLAPRDGFEPPAKRLTVACSTAELPGTNTTLIPQFTSSLIKFNPLFHWGVTSRAAKDLPNLHMISWIVFSLCSFEKSFCVT